MAEDEIDIEGDFDFKLEANSDVYDTNELPSKSANLLPEYTNPAWMLEQGWSMDSYIDEKSKATIEKMLQEEQYYLNGQKGRRTIRNLTTHKQPWSVEEKNLFLKGLEIYGRSWSKIAELIPTRTNLQVKNFAQQYFKQQMRANKSHVTEEDDDDGDVKPKKSHPATLEQMLRSVTTASPTITVSSYVKSQNHVTATTNQNNVQNHMTGLPNILKRGKHEEDTELKTLNSKLRLEDTMLGKELTKNDKFKRTHVSKNNGKAKKTSSDVNKNKKVRLDKTFSGVEVMSNNQTSLLKPTPLVKIKNVKMNIGNSSSKNHTNKETIGLHDVIEVVTIPTVQLSPTLEHKLETSTGVIENLDRFCAVADIVSGSGNCSEEEDIDIDIENEDDNEDNFILKNRSTSPNSVYESLLKSAKVKTKSNKPYNVKDVVEEKQESDTETDRLEKGCSEVQENLQSSESSEDGMSETGNQSGLSESGNQSGVVSENDYLSDSNQVAEKKIANMVVLSNGEVVEFPIPTEEKHFDPEEISDEERRVHLEFFDGRPSKTPDRYLKIRNYILDSWNKSKPNYLNKTSVRPGLKNCGDVNCIGRIHAYLECIGAINFGCDQCCYNHPVKLPTFGTKERTSRDVLGKSVKTNTMRPRKRKVKDAYGNWIDVDELQGKTIEHQDKKDDVGEKWKSSKEARTLYDPFKLIPCVSFTEEKQAPFNVEISNSCLVIMDVHAHIAKTEIIGMLGGQFDDGRLHVSMAIPCNSISTGMQCEMDPVSQTQASEEIQKYGLAVVGWYHSHPTFEPNPSVRDIETQLKFQEWFSKGGSSYIGIIISPYSRLNNSLVSEVRCLTIGDDIDPVWLCNTPYKFEYDLVPDSPDSEGLMSIIQQLAKQYSTYQNRVDMLGSYRSFTGHTCLSKMLVSISELSSHQLMSSDFLGTVENLFTELFSRQEILDTTIEYTDLNTITNQTEGLNELVTHQSEGLSELVESYGESSEHVTESFITDHEQIVDFVTGNVDTDNFLLENVDNNFTEHDNHENVIPKEKDNSCSNS